ncbi:MAG: glutamine amidotransferase [Pseudomonadota bacterium]
MKLTIVETGLPPAPIRADWPRYPEMFARLLSAADGDLSFESVALSTGAALPDPAGLDAVLITGSPSGVYDAEPWMGPLMDFIRWSAAAKTPLVGVCFGHQAMAQALGGRAAKSDKGWGVGRHDYEIVARPDWLDGGLPGFALGVSHQDQVLAPPPGARVVATSDFTPYAALSYETTPAISFQGHPEFEDDYSAALYTLRRGAPVPEALADAAIASLGAPHNNADVARWIARFLRETRETRARSDGAAPSPR